ncbi:MAG: NAD(P)H-dependent oxidoreductase subunit E [Spirochaetales bacterium]|nr:NAD(P)H-dependent oxidoreductase subunit E [Spirochaetales bacterium]
MENELLEKIIRRYEGDDGMLVSMLQDLQGECGYLPADALRGMAQQLEIPLSRIYGVAMFYQSFRLAPKAQHEVTVCMGTLCHLKGAPDISEAICKEYHIQPGETTADRLFTLQAANCVGACALAPVMIIDGQYYDGVSPSSAIAIIRDLPVAEENAS